MNGIQGIFTYLSQNIRDPKEKKILEKINQKYGPIYMIASLSKKKEPKPKEFTNEYYYPPLIKEAEFSPDSLETLTVCNELPEGRFTSFRFIIHKKDILQNDIFLINNGANTASLEIQLGGMYFNSDGIGSDQFISPPETIYQVNIGWSQNNDLLIEWFKGEEHNGIFNISTLTNEQALITSYQTSGSFKFYIFNNTEITFFTPIETYASETFMSNYT